jgi:hypothetical protein
VAKYCFPGRDFFFCTCCSNVNLCNDKQIQNNFLRTKRANTSSSTTVRWLVHYRTSKHHDSTLNKQSLVINAIFHTFCLLILQLSFCEGHTYHQAFIYISQCKGSMKHKTSTRHDLENRAKFRTKCAISLRIQFGSLTWKTESSNTWFPYQLSTTIQC